MRVVWLRHSSLWAPILSLVSLAGCGGDDGAPPDEPVAEETEAVCYDEIDNDLDTAVDCEDSECAELVTCCIGRADEACCDAIDQVWTSSVASCVEDVLESCAPELAVFGEPEPTVVADGIAGSDSPVDSGVYIADPIDPRGAAFRISFEAATASGCIDDCLSYIGVGLTPVEPATGFTRLQYLQMAVALRPARGDMALFLGGTDVVSWPLTDTAFHRYAIDVRPGVGVTILEIDDTGATIAELVPEFPADLPDPAYVVVAGRTVNIGDGTPARVRSLEIERGRCDAPARAVAELDPVIPLPGSEEVADLPNTEGVGRAKNAAGDEVVVIDTGDAFHLLRPDSSGDYRPTRDLSMPIVEASALPGVSATTIDDPWIVANEDSSRWELYFTVRTGDNDSSIGRISSAASFADGFDYGTFTVVAEPDSAFPKLEMPTVLGDRMIARAANVDAGILVRLLRDGPDTWVPVGARLADGRIHGPDFGNLFAMDRDEVADPALVSDDGMLRLYFAGRGGTRWTIGLLVSIDGEHWLQPLGDEPLLKWDGIGFDSLGLMDPAPLIDDGQATILYVGTDGARTSGIGRAYSGTTRAWP